MVYDYNRQHEREEHHFPSTAEEADALRSQENHDRSEVNSALNSLRARAEAMGMDTSAINTAAGSGVSLQQAENIMREEEAKIHAEEAKKGHEDAVKLMGFMVGFSALENAASAAQQQPQEQEHAFRFNPGFKAGRHGNQDEFLSPAMLMQIAGQVDTGAGAVVSNGRAGNNMAQEITPDGKLVAVAGNTKEDGTSLISGNPRVSPSAAAAIEQTIQEVKESFAKMGAALTGSPSPTGSAEALFTAGVTPGVSNSAPKPAVEAGMNVRSLPT